MPLISPAQPGRGGWEGVMEDAGIMNFEMPAVQAQVGDVPHERAVKALVGRLVRVMESVVLPGSVTVLLGEPGTGKGHLAVHAGEQLALRLGRPVEVVVLPPPRAGDGTVSMFFPIVQGMLRPTGDLEAEARELLDRLIERTGKRELVIVVQDVDDASPRDLALLEMILDEPGTRLIMTARRLIPDVTRIRKHRRGAVLSIGPLDRAEAETVLCAVLGVERVESGTLSRWMEASGGNSFGLTATAIAADQAGRVRRARGAAWVPDDGGDLDAPSTYAQLIAATCSSEEWLLLERIAVAEPVSELALLRRLDSAPLATLIERGLVSSRDVAGRASLQVAHKLLGASIRAGMMPSRRIELSDEIFSALESSFEGRSPSRDPEGLLRIVTFGLAAERDLPLQWLWDAFRLSARAGEPRAALRLAVAVACHPDATPDQLVTGITRATRIARKIGDHTRLQILLEQAERVLEDEQLLSSVDPGAVAGLRIVIAVERVWRGGSADDALELIEGWIADAGDEPIARTTYQGAAFFLLAATGRLEQALRSSPDPELNPDLQIEWAKASSRAIRAFLLVQRGEPARAIEEALRSRMISGLAPGLGGGVEDLLGFAWFVALWASGDAEAAREAYAELTQTAPAASVGEMRASGLAETAEVLLALQEGRWIDADEAAERVLERFSRSDGYCVAPFAHAARALAQAVLGERAAAARSIRAALDPSPGISQALGGLRELLVLRAMQWLGLPEAIDRAGGIIAGAERAGHAFVELLARHFVVTEGGDPSEAEVERIRHLAEAVSIPLGDAILAHVEQLSGDSALGEDDPEIRVLAEHGLWLAIPGEADLTAREREVALLAALGHSSRFISERLHISPRTVERHLSNVYTKLGLESRDGLREWAARMRRQRRRRNG